jgi:hypothetical protein
MKINLNFKGITLKPSTDTQKQSGVHSENTCEILVEDKQENKSGKSNSELMAEFFSINSEAENK